jgi:putative endonuclease
MKKALSHKKQTYDRGLKAEKIAALYLRVKGYKILHQRYKTPFGEIDLIAQKGNVTAFVEVKARSTQAKALESLTPIMRRRIERAAGYFAARQSAVLHRTLHDLRFDLITLSTPLRIHHLDNAWRQGT